MPPPMIASSSMSKESTSYDMADFDQTAIFLYLDGHDPQSIQEQRQTLNIFPSQPMHAAEALNPAAKINGGTVMAAMLANGGNPQQPSPKRPVQQQQLLLQGAPGGSNAAPSLPSSAKDNKNSASLVKKEGTSSGKGATSSSTDPDREGVGEHRTLRLAQNREAARKSRLRKKAYIQQLETSRIRLSQIEQQVQAGRVQGVLLGTGDHHHQGLPSAPSFASMFDMEYGRWVEEHSKLIFQLRALLNDNAPDNQVQVLVGGAMAHHEELLSLKAAIARTDIFHLLCGVWASPAERCFLWLGGFRPTEVIKIMLKQVESLSEGQLLGIYNLQRWVQETEESLNHTMGTLQHSLSDTIASPEAAGGNFMGHMSLALNKISSMEAIVRQADALRQQTLHKLHGMLTVRQVAHCFVSIADYVHRLRAVSSPGFQATARRAGPAGAVEEVGEATAAVERDLA
ncbi:hypothetical protein ZWY2020_039517 [Hordeum vulgare]|nr:hypothetical protein ZWY2020_039517 [Hordeum vulgare]